MRRSSSRWTGSADCSFISAFTTSNMSSSLRSSPMHMMKSGSPWIFEILDNILDTATPLLMPESFTWGHCHINTHRPGQTGSRETTGANQVRRNSTKHQLDTNFHYVML